jgi:3-hydroxymyristoyl/3-hydroxydecanoyl-(acyl carrier protein) dehydratase
VNALLVLLAILEGFERHGGTVEQALDALRAIEARARLGTRPPTEAEKQLLAQLGEPRQRIGFSGAVDVKLMEPVFAGSTIHYRVALTHEMQTARRFEVQATVRDRPVARGSMTSAMLTLPTRA